MDELKNIANLKSSAAEFVAVLFRPLLPNRYFPSLGTSRCRIRAPKRTLSPSKTFMLQKNMFDKNEVWDVKLLLTVLWGPLGLVFDALGRLLAVILVILRPLGGISHQDPWD